MDAEVVTHRVQIMEIKIVNLKSLIYNSNVSVRFYSPLESIFYLTCRVFHPIPPTIFPVKLTRDETEFGCLQIESSCTNSQQEEKLISQIDSY